MRVYILFWFYLFFNLFIKYLLSSLFLQCLLKHIQDLGKLLLPLVGQQVMEQSSTRA